MKQFLIEDIKAFTTHLFLQPTFDSFFLREAMFKTAATVTIDGAANADYFDTDEGVPEHVTWGSVRFRSSKGTGFRSVSRSSSIRMKPRQQLCSALMLQNRPLFRR